MRSDRFSTVDPLLKFGVRLHLLFALGGMVITGTTAPLIFKSPDGKVELGLHSNKDQALAFEINLNGSPRVRHPVIETSQMSMIVDGRDLGRNVSIGKVNRYRIRERYPWRGAHSEAINHCNGAHIQMSAGEMRYEVEVRVFDEGAAFRFIVPGQGVRVPNEATVFTLPTGSVVWLHDLNGHYEGAHQRKMVSEIRAGDWAAPPLTFKLPNDAGYGSITEAALVNYSGMALQASGEQRFKVVLGDQHPISHPYRLRYSNDIARVSQPARIDGTIVSPWRVVLAGEDLNSLVNADVIHDLCPAPDPKLFPEGIKTSWIRPGRTVWKYLDGGQNTIEGTKEFCRLAEKLGFEYNVVEGYWSKWSDEQISDVVAYSRQKGVGLWFWKHSKDLRTPEARETFFRKLHDFSVAGAKIDFFDHEHKEVIDLYQELLADAAKYQIMVNFHGANKPTGGSRTWPNEMVREAIKGMESSRFQNRAMHDATVPFTRFLAGPADYTPVHFGARRADTTWTHQIATAVAFTAPLLTYGAHPTNLLNNPAVEMIKAIPSTWDETIVLPPSEIGEVAAFARRRGDTWFLALVNGPEPRSFKMPLSFLKAGNYQALLVRDVENDSASLKVEKATVRQKQTLLIDTPAGGGFVGRFSRN